MPSNLLSEELDEYDSYDFSEFAEEDFAYEYPPHAGPSITIELEQQEQTHAAQGELMGQQRAVDSPFDEFRGGGVFSVTDLVSPAWCEVQFDYGLRQRRSRRIESRPTSFSSTKGKIINVEPVVAERNDVVTRQGRVSAVHKELEREIKYEEISVNITTDEERWALRIINMLYSLDCLETIGCAREMPVFGIIHEQVVVGIIDEIHRKSAHAEESSPNVVSDPTETPNYTLHVVDTKTRRTNSLPKDEDTIQSKFQVMLYHRLLTKLIQRDASGAVSFNFTEIWERLCLDPLAVFSDAFKTQTRLIFPRDNANISCLDDVARIWPGEVLRLDVGAVDTNLRLIYRTQPTKALTVTAEEQEQIDIARAIEAGLKDNIGIPTAVLPDPDPLYFKQPKDTLSSKVIGTKDFALDDKLLDVYLANVLLYWHGKRDPVGVDLQNSGRCFSCEYMHDCEWRETKASEAETARIQRKSSRS